VTADDDVIGAKPSVEAKPNVEQAPARPDWVADWVPSCLSTLWWRLDDLDPVRAAMAAIPKRLLTDVRIKPAYAHMTAKRKRDDRYRLPAQEGAIRRFVGVLPESKPQEWLQEWVITHIVLVAIRLAQAKPGVSFQREIDSMREKRKALASKLRELADEAEQAFDDNGSAAMLDYAANLIEEVAEKTGFGQIVVDRTSDADEVRAFAMAMAKEFAVFFGDHCSGLVARFTAVALNLEIDLEVLRTRVRDWWAAYAPVLQREQAWREQQERNEATADSDED
jgi:hypothetical protein